MSYIFHSSKEMAVRANPRGGGGRHKREKVKCFIVGAVLHIQWRAPRPDILGLNFDKSIYYDGYYLLGYADRRSLRNVATFISNYMTSHPR
jgi:hypothetical protein